MPDSTGRRPRVSMSRTGPDDKRTPEEVAATVLKLDPIELEERVEFLNKPLIIENAFSGWQPRRWAPEWAFKEANRKPPEHYEEGGIRFPAVPTTIEEQVEGLVEGIEAGCAVTHVHPRDQILRPHFSDWRGGSFHGKLFLPLCFRFQLKYVPDGADGTAHEGPHD